MLNATEFRTELDIVQSGVILPTPLSDDFSSCPDLLSGSHSRKRSKHAHESTAPGVSSFESLFAQIVHEFTSSSCQANDAAIGEALVRVCQALQLDACAL